MGRTRGTTKKQDDGKNGRMRSFMICTFIKYVGYPESKFRWAIKKKPEYITNHVYCHLMYNVVQI